MASFTDAISQFNPYVQQLPVELMMKVGMAKQAQYDQGVQKIQSYIDNVAGLKTSRPQDKAYLESKLGELGNDLKYVAAGDFSNQQLVSSVGGMASQIVKDPYIQAAVYSSAQIKKNAEKMAEAEKKGELAPENVDLYQTELNKYMGGKLGDQFDGSYIPYVDVADHLKEVAKATGIDETVIPELFQTGTDGKVIMERDPRTGQVSPKINKVMAERHIKGKTAEKLLTAFNNSLTPKIKRQLAITGIYENKALTPEMLSQKVKDTFTGHVDRLRTEIERINVAESLASGSEYDPEKLQILQQAKQDAVDALGKIEKQRDEASNLDYVAKNADSIRANLYSTNYLQGMAAQMKEVSDITKYSVNPWFDVTMRENAFSLQLKQEARQAKEFSILRQEHANDKASETAKWRLDFYAANGYWPEDAGKPKPGEGAILGPIDEKDYEGIRSSFEGGYLADVDAQNANAKGLAMQYLRGLNPKLSDQELMKNIETWSGGKDKSKTAMMNRFAGYLVTNYQKNPRSVPAAFHEQIENFVRLNNNVSAKGDAIREIEKIAKQTALEQGLDYNEYKDVLSKITPISIGISDKGKPQRLTLSKEDVMDIVKSHPELMAGFGRFGVTDDQKVEASAANFRLIAKYGQQKYAEIDEALKGNSQFPYLSLIQNAKVLDNSAFKKISKIKGELYAKSDLIPRTLIDPLKINAKNKDEVEGKVSGVLAKYAQMPNLDPSFTYDNGVKVMNGDGAKVHFEIKQVNGKMQYTMVNTSKEGTSRAIVEPEDYTNITGKPAHAATDLDPMFLKLNSSGTTDKGGVPWFSGKAFPLLMDTKYKGTTGNIIRDEANPDKVWFNLNVPGLKKPITFPDPVTHPQGLSKRNPDGTLNTGLSMASYAISPAIIDALIQKNNK